MFRAVEIVPYPARCPIANTTPNTTVMLQLNQCIQRYENWVDVSRFFVAFNWLENFGWNI